MIPNQPAGEAMQLLKIEQDANNYSTYTYNGDGLLSSFINVHNQVTSHESTTYGADKKPLAVTLDDETYKLSFNGDKITQIDVYEQQNHTAYFTYTYTGDKITEADYYVFSDLNTKFLAAKTLSVYNSAGDLSSQKLYYTVGTSLQLASTTAYEYDAKNNPLAGSFNLSSVLLNSPAAHNVTKQTQYDAGGNVSETDTYTISYNTQNYPVQIACKTVKPGAAEVSTGNKFTYK